MKQYLPFFQKQKNRMHISHLTDLEGNYQYFANWLKSSEHMTHENGNLQFSNPSKNQKFIFGGDFCDKGPGDLRIGNMLVDFKTANPTKVSLLAGNREIKCTRFSTELQSNIRERLLHGEEAFWNKGVRPRDYVIRQMQSQKLRSTTQHDVKDFIRSLSEQECQTIYLKWMLFETMGCGGSFNKPNTYEYRRMELAEMSGLAPENICDNTVTQSFINSVAPEGVVTRYLKNAQLGKIVGDTLFIHGAITTAGMGYVPGLHDSTKAKRCTDAKEWINLLNDWYSTQINHWLANPVDESIQPPGNSALDQYLLFNPKSIVTTNWYTNGKLAPVPEQVIKFLNKAGICRVVTGHQPFADFPLIIRHPNLDVYVGDTSYSDIAAPHDTRGKARHNLLIVQENPYSYVSIDGVFKDGSRTTMSILPNTGRHRSGLGHFDANGNLIRHLNGSNLCASQLDGFAVQNYEIEETKAKPAP